MNPSEDARQNVYKSILKTASKRLEQAVPGSSETVAKFGKVFRAQHLRFSLIRTPSHGRDFTTFVFCSPFV
jgi:hypothetical protein